MNWNRLWEWISKDKYERLQSQQNIITGSITPTNNKNKNRIFINIDDLSIEEERIYTLCSILDDYGIRLFLSDWLIQIPDNMKKDELVGYCIDSVMYYYFILYIYIFNRKQRTILSNKDLSFLPEEQLKRMIADIGFPYQNNNSCDELSKILQHVYIYLL